MSLNEDNRTLEDPERRRKKLLAQFDNTSTKLSRYWKPSS